MAGGENAQKLAGDVAQLVERRNGIAEVTGSTPVVSTKRWLDLVRPACLVGISCGFRLPSRDQYHLFMEVPRDGVFNGATNNEDQRLPRSKRGGVRRRFGADCHCGCDRLDGYWTAHTRPSGKRQRGQFGF